MSPVVWKQLGAAALAAGVISLLGTQLQWAKCSLDTANELDRPFVSQADPDAMAQRVLRVQTQFETRGEPIPKSQWARFVATGPVCRAEHSQTEAAPFWAATVMFFLFGLFARNQSNISADQANKERTTRRRPEEVQYFDKPKRTQLYDDVLEETMPDAIEVSEGFDLGLDNLEEEDLREEDGDSLMDYVEERRQIEESKSEEPEPGEGLERFGGFYCPHAYGDKPVIYVDAQARSAHDDLESDRLDDPAKPFKTLDAALIYAGQRVIKDTPAIQVRIAPGVYQCAITVPDRCVVVNHRMPGKAEPQRRLEWLVKQGLDSPDRVTILPPADQSFAVKFSPGQMQGIYGCYMVGREGVPQTGVMMSASMRATIFNCVFESFGKSGVRLENSGAELPGHAVDISACQFFENIAGHGGGINAKKSVVNVRDCMFQQNRAHSGGAIWAEDLKRPMLIKGCRFSKNAAQGPDPGELKPSLVRFRAWVDMEGLGGAIALLKCRSKITGTEFVDNKANVAGGALAALGAQVVVQGDDDHDIRFERNSSRMGGAVFTLGWQGAPCTFKLETGDVQHNRAKHSGGGLCGFGLSTLQMIDTKLAHNAVEHARGLGGGVGLHNGAEFLCKESDIYNNSSKGAGGGIGGINAYIKIGDEADIRGNSAAMSGGGVFCITEANDEMEDLVSAHNFKLPFILATQDCKITDNTADDLGAGVRAGNFAARSTFPLGVKIDGLTRLRNNRTKHPNEAGDDLWIVWNGETRGSTKNRPVDKILLK